MAMKGFHNDNKKKQTIARIIWTPLLLALIVFFVWRMITDWNTEWLSAKIHIFAAGTFKFSDLVNLFRGLLILMGLGGLWALWFTKYE